MNPTTPKKESRTYSGHLIREALIKKYPLHQANQYFLQNWPNLSAHNLFTAKVSLPLINDIIKYSGLESCKDIEKAYSRVTNLIVKMHILYASERSQEIAEKLVKEEIESQGRRKNHETNKKKRILDLL